MKTEIINNGTTEFPFYTVMVNSEEYCSTGDIKKAEKLVKLLSIGVVTKSFKIEVHNNSGAWYEIVLADSYLEGKMKVEKAYPNNTHVSLECEYDKPIF